jgi:hypothetical protein
VISRPLFTFDLFQLLFQLNRSVSMKTPWLKNSTALIMLITPLWAHAQADSTGAGLSQGDWKMVIRPRASAPVKPDREPAGFSYLLQDVLLVSMTDPNTNDTMGFGPFKNDSDYPITFRIDYIGGGRHKHFSIAEDGREICHKEGGYMICTVRAHASYSFNGKNAHRITASVPINSADIPATRLQFGLPTKEEFEAPRPVGAYVKCETFHPTHQEPISVSGSNFGNKTVVDPVYSLRYYKNPEWGWSDGSTMGNRGSVSGNFLILKNGGVC